MTDSVLSALDLKPEDKIIAIKEEKLADATFILTSIMSHCISNETNICLVILHNTIGHYHNIGRRFGYDLLNEIKEGRVKTIEPLKDIVDDISNDNKKYLSDNKESILKQLLLEIIKVTNELSQNNRKTKIIIDDLSHLSDLGIETKDVLTFIKCCIGLATKNNISLVLNYHVTSAQDVLVTNLMFYLIDLTIVVSTLKTGRSKNVSGLFSVHRKDEKQSITRQRVYHYKMFEKEIRTFAPGRALI